MEPYDFGFDEWQEILDTLEHGGMTDYEKYPEVHVAWKVAKETDDFTLLHELLTTDPWILMQAKKNIKERPFFQPKIEELHKIQGVFVLGFLINAFSAYLWIVRTLISILLSNKIFKTSFCVILNASQCLPLYVVY